MNRILLSQIGVIMMALLPLSGCNQQEAEQTLSDAETAAQQAAETVAEDVESAVEQGGQMASDLGEQAKAYLTPMTEKFGNLEDLKDSPEKLKAAVTELIESIEQKLEDIKLPEAMGDSLASIKEKLVALRDYLQGEYEQARIDEHVQDIAETVKSKFASLGE